MQFLDFSHQGFVYGQATGRVHQQHIYKVAARVIQGGPGNVGGFLVRRAGKPLCTSLGGDGFKLLNGRRAVHVTRHREHFFLAFFNQVLGQLGRGGGFTSTLQARHQNHGRWLRRQIQVADPFAHGGGQLFIDDAHQGLARGEGAQHLLPQCFFFDPRHKVAHHGQGHVGLEQRHSDFAQHVGHIGLGDARLPTHAFDEAAEFVRKG